MAHKTFRAKQKEALRNGEDRPTKMKEVSNTYTFSSDGLPHYEGFEDIINKQLSRFGWLKWFKK